MPDLRLPDPPCLRVGNQPMEPTNGGGGGGMAGNDQQQQEQQM